MTCAAGIALLAMQTTLSAHPTSAPDHALTRRYERARLRRDLGWGLSGVGIAAIVAGAAVLAYGFTIDCNPSLPACYDDVIKPHYYGGIAAMGIGVLHAIPGIVLALQGQGEMTDVEWRRGRYPRTAYVLPTPGGFVVGAAGSF